MSVKGETCPRERRIPREEGKKEKMSPSLYPREERKRLYSFSIALRASAEGAIGSLAVNMRPKAHKEGALSPQKAKKSQKI